MFSNITRLLSLISLMQFRLILVWPDRANCLRQSQAIASRSFPLGSRGHPKTNQNVCSSKKLIYPDFYSVPTLSEARFAIFSLIEATWSFLNRNFRQNFTRIKELTFWLVFGGPGSGRSPDLACICASPSCGGFKYIYFSESNRPVARAQLTTLTVGPRPSIASGATHGPIHPSLDQERGIGKAACRIGVPRPFSSSSTQLYQVSTHTGPFSSSSDAKRISSPQFIYMSHELPIYNS